MRVRSRPILVSALLLTAGAAASSHPDPLLRHAQEFRASTFTMSAQEQATIAVSPDGSMTVAWASRRQQGGRYGVYAQRFDADGVALGGETRLNLWTRSHASAPALDASTDGATWAVWQSSGQDGSLGAVIARRLEADLGGSSEVLVNERTEGEQSGPVVAALPDGGAVIAWQTAAASGAPTVALRIFGPDGSPRTGEIQVGDGTGRLVTPSVAARADGSLAVAYAAFDGATALGVHVETFGPEGVQVSRHRVSPPDAPTPVEPVIAATADGYVVAWQDVLEASLDYDVLARVLDSEGVPLDEPVLVNTDRRGLQNGAALCVAPDGAVSIAFNGDDGAGAGVFLREFDASLRARAPQARLTVHADGPQRLREATGARRLVTAPDGSLLCAWEGDSGFGDASGANVTRLSPAPLALGARTAGVTPAMEPSPFTDEPAVTLAGGPEPHEPPTFDPRQVEVAPREIVRGQGPEIGFTAVVNTGWTPPDPHMAVGPDHVVVMTNGAIAFYTKDGTRTFQDEIEDSFGFWGSVGATGFVFDPEVVYDDLSGRFFAMAAEAFAPGNRSYCLVAVSDDSDPNGTWHKYRLDTTGFSGDLFDSPNIGVTEDTLLITGDGFGIGANYPVYMFDKASFLVGDPPAISNSFTLSTSTQSAGYPRVTKGSGDTAYLVEHREANTNNTAIRIIAIENMLSSPSVSTFNLTVPAYGAPEDPPQMGTTSRPNTFDARFWSVDQGPDGHLWATHHINPSKVVARWYEIDLRGWPSSGSSPVLVQSGDVDLGPSVRTFFSSINASDDGSVAISFARSSPTEFISAASSFRAPCAAPGAMTEDFVHKVSVGGYTQGRWGDYSSVEFDPTDPSLYWAVHEYAENNSWRTWVQSVETYDPCLAADLNGDGAVNTLDVLEFLNAWSSADCRGDWNRDGAFNTLDVLAFLNAWTACRP